MNNKLVWSDQVYRIFGCKPQEFDATYVAFLSFIHPQDREMVDIAYRTSVAQRLPYQIEHRLLLKDGSIKYVVEKGVTYYDESGNAMESLGIVTDLTEYKLAEKIVKESQSTLNIIVNNIPQTIFWKDIQGIYQGCNQHFLKMIGLLRPEELIGKTDYGLNIPEEIAEMFRADDQHVMQNRTIKWHIDETYVQADGKRLRLNTTRIPLLDENNRVTGVIGVVEDVTAKKEAEEEVQTKSWALESSINAIADLEGRLNYVNDAFLKLWGYNDKKEVLGRPAVDFWITHDEPTKVITTN